MTLRTLKSAALLVALCLLPGASWAANAGLLLSPTRVVLENGVRFASVTVRNNGDGVGRYKIELTDTVMTENGGIKLRENGEKDEFSALDMISLSPRSMTLRPDENQNIRILIKEKADLPDGEYRSHLLVRMTESDLEPSKDPIAQKGVGIVLKPKMTTVIPIIIRKGTTNYKVALEDAQLGSREVEGKAVPEIRMNFSFSGNRSLLADVKVMHIAPDTKETQVAWYRGIAIYRGLTKRTQTALLEVPPGLDIHKGKLVVSLHSQENEGSQLLTSKEIVP